MGFLENSLLDLLSCTSNLWSPKKHCQTDQVRTNIYKVHWTNSILDIASLPIKHEARMNELPGTHIEGKDKLTGVLIGSQH